MSILIKGMEMPKHCAACPIERMDDYGDEIAFYCLLNDGDTKQVRAKCRRTDCPLVPVPPHGRLIDADEAIGHLFNGEQCLYSWDEIEEAIDATETVIPAEEGET